MSAVGTAEPWLALSPPVEPRSDRGGGSLFRRSWPIQRIWPTAAVVLGVIAAVAWVGILGYAIIKLVQRAF